MKIANCIRREEVKLYGKTRLPAVCWAEIWEI